MSDDIREHIQRALDSINEDCKKLDTELGGCRSLCNQVLKWIENGRKLVERLEVAEKAIVRTLHRWDETRDALQARLDRETDDADWWKG